MSNSHLTLIDHFYFVILLCFNNKSTCNFNGNHIVILMTNELWMDQLN